MDDRAELHRFAELLMRVVRDQSIRDLDALAARWMGPPDKRWRGLLSGQNTRATVQELIPDMVDQVLFRLLHALDHRDLPLGWQREDGSYVNLSDLGKSEMVGWLVTTEPDSWRARYSSQRWTEA
jgi:hypothetical protein